MRVDIGGCLEFYSRTVPAATAARGRPTSAAANRRRIRGMAIDRRTFLAGTVAAAAAPRLHASAQSAAPASDRIRIGFAGMGARAQELVDAIAASGTPAEIVALCDAYRGRTERGKARAGGRAAIVDDYRRLLDDRTIDAVFIATPDHWHARMAIDAVS